MPKRIKDLPAEYTTHKRAIGRAIGLRLRHRREQLKWTQDQLRAKLELEQIVITRTQYSRIENGDTLPNAAELLALRTTLNVSFDWLLLGD